MAPDEPTVCAFCGRATAYGRAIHERGTLPGTAPYGLCCQDCDLEFTELAGRLIRINRPGHKDRLVFDPGSDQRVPRVWRREARLTVLVNGLLGRLHPVTPSAARIIALTESVFVPPEPRAHPDRQSALGDIANQLANALRNYDKSYSYRLGTVGVGAGIVLQKTLDDLLSGQYLCLLDTRNSVHAFFWYSR